MDFSRLCIIAATVEILRLSHLNSLRKVRMLAIKNQTKLVITTSQDQVQTHMMSQWRSCLLMHKHTHARILAQPQQLPTMRERGKLVHSHMRTRSFWELLTTSHRSSSNMRTHVVIARVCFLLQKLSAKYWSSAWPFTRVLCYCVRRPCVWRCNALANEDTHMQPHDCIYAETHTRDRTACLFPFLASTFPGSEFCFGVLFYLPVWPSCSSRVCSSYLSLYLFNLSLCLSFLSLLPLSTPSLFSTLCITYLPTHSVCLCLCLSTRTTLSPSTFIFLILTPFLCSLLCLRSLSLSLYTSLLSSVNPTPLFILSLNVE